MTRQTKKLTILSADFAVGTYLTPQLLSMAKTLGYASVINTMPAPDSVLEDIGANALANNARNCGMEYHQFSVGNIGIISEDDIAGFQDLLDELPKPILAFSRTGLTATALWAASMVDTMDWEEIVMSAERAGLDISFLINSPAVPSLSKVA